MPPYYQGKMDAKTNYRGRSNNSQVKGIITSIRSFPSTFLFQAIIIIIKPLTSLLNIFYSHEFVIAVF